MNTAFISSLNYIVTFSLGDSISVKSLLVSRTSSWNWLCSCTSEFRFDDKVSSFGAVCISDSIMTNTGNCVKCTVDGEVGSISIMDFLYIIHSLLLISTGKEYYTPCLCSQNGRCDHEKLLPREHILLPLSIT